MGSSVSNAVSITAAASVLVALGQQPSQELRRFSLDVDHQARLGQFRLGLLGTTLLVGQLALLGGLAPSVSAWLPDRRGRPPHGLGAIR